MLRLQRFQRVLLVLVVFEQAFAVQLAIRAGMCVLARGEQIRRDITNRNDECDDFNLFLDLWQAGEEFGIGIAMQNVRRDRISGLVGRFQTICVGLIEEDLGFQHIRRAFRDPNIIAQGQINQDFDRWATFHMRQQLKREFRRDFSDGFLTEDNVF